MLQPAPAYPADSRSTIRLRSGPVAAIMAPREAARDILGSFPVKISGFYPLEATHATLRSDLACRSAAPGGRWAGGPRGASNEARMRPHKAAAAIRLFAAEAASGECRARSGRRRWPRSSWRRGMMSMRPAKRIGGDRSTRSAAIGPEITRFRVIWSHLWIRITSDTPNSHPGTTATPSPPPHA